jgi:iron complex outermembrane receptor protein
MRKRKFQGMALMAVAAVTTLPVLCHAGDDTTPASELQQVVVVGTTPLQLVKTPLSQVPSNVQSATSLQIDQQESLNLGEFLDGNLGSVNASNSVGNPYQMDISYRGFTASPILGTAVGLSVYVDGVRVNEPFGDMVNWDLIPANAIATVELIPGSNPLFGFNTLGGAISVTTKNGEDFPGVKVTAYGGSRGRRAVEAEAGSVDAAHAVDTYVAATVFHEDGWRDYSGSDVRQLFGKARWHDGNNRLDLSVSVANNTLYGPSVLPLSMLDTPRIAYTAPDVIDNRLAMVELKGSHDVTSVESVEGDVYFRLGNSVNANSNASCDDDVGEPENCVANQASGDLDASNVIADTHQQGYGAAAQWNLLGDLWQHDNRLVLGGSVDAADVHYDSNNFGANLVDGFTSTIQPTGADAINQTGSNPFFQGGTSLRTTSSYIGMFATDNFRIDEHWNLNLSGRFNVATVHLHGATNDGSGNLSSLDGNHSYHRLNPAVGLNFNPTKALTFYGGYNQGMRVPTPVELSCANPELPCALPTGFTSDPALGMIVSKTWEGGARGKVSAAIGWDVAVYDSRNENDIQFIANGADAGVTGYFKNVGATRRRGLELGLHGKFTRWAVDMHYGLVDATYQSSFLEASPQNSSADDNGNVTVVKGNRIPGIARQTFKLRGDVDVTSAWNLGATLDATSGQYPHGDENDQDVNGTLKGYALVNLDTHVKLGDRWSAFAKVDNLFDRGNYHTFGILAQNMYTAQNELAVVPALPRGVWVGLSYAFGSQKAPTGGTD